MKIFAIAAMSAVALGLASTGARAADAVQAGTLPPTYIIYKLTQDGVQLRKLEAEGGVYEARVEAADGNIVKVGVDPQTAELTDAVGPARVRKGDGSTPKVDAAEAILAVAATGHWDIREVEFENGAWQIASGDDNGRMGKFTVDAITGAIR